MKPSFNLHTAAVIAALGMLLIVPGARAVTLELVRTDDGGAVELLLTGQVGSVVLVQSSANLEDWEEVTEVRLEKSFLWIPVTTEAPGSVRFFRAVQLLAAEGDPVVPPVVAIADDNGRYYVTFYDEGGFTELLEIARLNGNSRGAAVGDFDRDGVDDLVFGGNGSGNVIQPFFFKGLPDKTYAAPVAMPVTPNSGGYMMGAVAGDFDADGRLDVLANGNSGTVGAYWGNGDGTFVQQTLTWPGNGRAMDGGDFNEDGYFDIVRATYGDGIVRLYLSNDDRTFTEAPQVVGDAGGDPYGLAAGDFDEDGHLDVLVNEGASGSITLFSGLGDGTFAAGVAVPELDIDNHAAFNTYDFDGDGHLDIVLTAYSARMNYFWPGNGDGTFGARVDLPGRPAGNALGLSTPLLPEPLDIAIQPFEPVVALNEELVLQADGADVTAGDPVEWTFGDGATDEGVTVGHAWGQEGQFVARFLHEHSSGRLTRRGTVVTVQGAPPVADPGGPYELGEAAASELRWTASLDGAGSSDDFGIERYEWDFGDGSAPAEGAQVAHTWDGVGPWTVSLTVTDSSGQQATADTTVRFTHGDAPTAMITGPAVMDESMAASGKWTAEFSGASSTDDFGIWKYEWDLGNGQTATGQTVTAQYAAQGEYTVTLTVTDHAGTQDSTQFVTTVEAVSGPFADFTGPLYLDESYASAHAWTAEWDASISVDDTGIYKYIWDFGDGSAAVESGTPLVSHSFAAPGIYTVSLTVVDHGNLTDTWAYGLEVAVNDPPTADVQVEGVPFEGAQPIVLNGSGSTDDFGIWQYIWHLQGRLLRFPGQEINRGEWIPRGVVFQDDAMYVTGNNNWNQNNLVYKGVQIARGGAIEALVHTPVDSGLMMLGWKDLNADTGHYNTLVYGLYFNNGNLHVYERGTNRGVVGTYLQGESYEVRLETKPDAGAFYFIRPAGAQEDFELLYNSDYAADSAFLFGMDVNKGAFGLDNLWLPNGHLYGESVSASVDPSGQVTLEVVDHAGQSGFASVDLESQTGEPPVAAARLVDPARPLGAHLVAFDGSDSTDDYGIASYVWDFGDGTEVGFGPKVSHYFATSGTYQVTLTVYDHAGQSDSTELEVVVSPTQPVVTVPWRYVGDVEIPHDTWSGHEITLKAVAEGMPLPFDYEWRFGDGSPVVLGTATTSAEARALEAKHVYTGSVGTPFRAMISVFDADGNRYSDEYPVMIRAKNIQVEINVAIDEGLWYLHKTQTGPVALDANNLETHWTFSSYTAGVTASAVQAFAINGHLETMDPNRDPYVVNVIRGVNYLLTRLISVNIGMQAFGDPDTNGNGTALNVNSGQPIYELGQVMDAFVALGAPDLVARTGGANIKGRSYRELVQDMADMYSWGQTDGDVGGWRYSWNSGIDNSAAQWGAIGYLAGEHLYGTQVPQWVKDRNLLWVESSQGSRGYGYTGRGDGLATTASAMVQLAWTGVPRTDPLWMHGENFLASRWNDNDFIKRNNLYLFYALTKAMRIALPTPVVTFEQNGFDWFLDPTNGLARTLLDRQDPVNGSWIGQDWITDRPYGTAWGVIMLSSSLFTQAPVADIRAQPNPAALGQRVVLDGLRSYHQDPTFSIVQYLWDFDNSDGIDFDNPDAVGPIVETSFSALATYTVSLRVLDNNAPQQADVTSIEVLVSIPPHPPTADAGGPYIAAAGEPIILDGSGSFDIDTDFGDGIRSWDWEIDFVFPLDFDDGVRGETAVLAAGLPEPGQYDIGLRVTDSTEALFPQAESPDLSNDDFTTIYVYPERGTDLMVRSKLIKNQLVWTKVGDYAEVQRSAVGPNRGFETIATTDSDFATYLDNGLEPNKAYYYRLVFYENGNANPIGASNVVRAFPGDADRQNLAPVFVSEPRVLSVAGLPYGYSARAEDPEGESVTYLLVDGPVGMTIGAASGLVEFMPGVADIGLHQVVVRATDPEGLSAEQIYELEIVANVTNQAPVILTDPPLVALVDQPYLYQVLATDPEGQQLTWTLPLGPTGMEITPEGLLSWTPTQQELGEHAVTIRVADPLDAIDLQDYTLLVRTNVAPVADAGSDQAVIVGSEVTLDGSGSADADSDPITLEWSFVELPDGSQAELDDAAVADPRFTVDLPGEYILQLSVSDGFAVSVDTITVSTVNRAPVANAGWDRVIAVGATVDLDGALSFDPDGDTLTYAWTLTARPQGSNATILDPNAAQTSFVADLGGTYTVELVVHDGQTGSVPAQVTFEANNLPVADPGPDLEVYVGDVVHLDGSGSNDPDDDPLTYLWSLDERPADSSVELSDETAERPTIMIDRPGVYSLSLVVHDGKQSSESAGISLTTINRNPVAAPGGDRVVGPGELVQLDATGSQDPDGDTLTYLWELLNRPTGSNAVLSDPADPKATFPADAYGEFHLMLVVSDGILDSEPEFIVITVANTPPVADAGPAQTVLIGSLVQLDGSGSADPNGDAITHQWSLTQRPAGSSAVLSSPTSPSPTFTADRNGEFIATLVVNDGALDSAPDQVTITVELPAVEVPNVVGMAEADAETELVDAGFVAGEIVYEGSLDVPAGIVMAQDPVGGTMAPGGSAVDLVVSSGPPIDFTPPRVSVTAAPQIVNIGDPVTIEVTATDDLGLVDLTLEVNGELVALDGDGRAVYLPAAEGLYTAIARAEDNAGLIGTDDATFMARAQADNDGPQVALTAPADDAVLDLPTDLIGTATDDDLVWYRLEAAPAGSAEYGVFAEGFTSVTDGVLGLLDPRGFTPGLYDVRVCAADSWGNLVCSAPMRYELNPGAPPAGVTRMAFLDGFAQVTGLPLVVRRIYDSRNKAKGDFGVGWTLETDEVKLEVTRVMGEDWEVIEHGGFFPTYQMAPSKDHRVVVTLPDGKVYRFQMSVSPATQQLFPYQFVDSAIFNPMPGTDAKLLAHSHPSWVDPVANYSSPVTLLDDEFNTYNPSGYTLRLTDGRSFVFRQVGGFTSQTYRLSSITDANGNTVTFSNNGITHSAGASVSMERDAQGRITAVTNAEGDRRTYVYDEAGDLVATTDYEGAETQYIYDPKHNLLQIVDPRGQIPGTLIYDADGRIIGVIDAQGNQITLEREEGSNQEVVTDRLGNTTVLTYDPRGNIISTVDPLGNETTMTYDENDNLTSRVDPLGNVQTWTYDADGNLLTYIDPEGNTRSYEYDDSGRITAETDPLGRKTQFEYDASGNETLIVTPGGGRYEKSYDGSGNLTKVVNPLGAELTLEYNAQGRVNRFVDPLGRATEIETRSDGQVTRESFMVDGQEIAYEYGYNANGDISSVALPNGNSSELQFDESGYPVGATDTRGLSQGITRDALDQIDSFTNYDGGTIAIERDAEGQVVKVVNPNGQTMDRTLDPLGRPEVVRLPNGLTVTTEYDEAGRILSQSRGALSATTFEYDKAGRVVKRTASDGGVTTFEYDAASQMTATVDPLGGRTEFVYDPDGNLVETHLPDGATLKSEFDLLKRLTAIEDERGARMEYEYDLAGMLIAATDTAGGRTDYGYNEMGVLVEATTPGGSVWGFTYDELGTLNSRTYPWGGTEAYTLDALGGITEITDATGKTTEFEYDAAGNVIAKRHADGWEETRTYNLDRQLLTADEPTGQSTYSYAGNGRVERIDYPGGNFVEYTYTADGQLSSVRTPGGETNYTYDSEGRLIGLEDTALGEAQYAYDIAGRLIETILPDGSTTTYTRNARGWITRVETLAADGTTVLRDTEMTYDPAGNPLSVTELDRDVDYVYDAAGRIVEENRTGADADNMTYAYDADWNLTTKGDRTLGYDSSMLLTSDGRFDSYAYDAAGRPIQRSGGGVLEKFEYDSLGRLVRLERQGATPNLVELQYNHANLLSRIEADGAVRQLLWDVTREIPQLMEERDGDGQLLRRYVYGLGPVGVVDGTTHVLHIDSLGSVRMITDNSGAVAARYAFAAYGDQTRGAGDTTSSLRYAGELFVPELGMYYLRARFYDPGAGRFLTPDLYQTIPTQPQTFNPFLYANGNPVRFTDPMGTYSLGSISVGMAVVNILVSIALPHFPQPVLIIAKALGLTQADAQVGISLALAISKGWAAGGIQFDFLYGPNVWKAVIWIYAGAQIGSARGDPRLESPQVTFWLGSIYGTAGSDPDDPRAGIYLLITGNAARIVGDYATKGRYRNTKVEPGYERGAAGIQFEIAGINKGGEIGSSFFQAFTLYGSPWGGIKMPPVKIKKLDREMRFAGGLSLTLYLPVFWFTWDGNSIEGDSWFSGM